MKTYKKIMDVLAGIEKLILVVSTILILVLTVGNVFSRKVIHRSWSFTEELVVAVFVLITLLAAALACREGELVSLNLVTERLPEPDKLILVSFKNCSFPMIGRYTVDGDGGGTFRIGDEDESFIEYDLYVNAWMPLPECYKEEKENE